MLQQSQKSVWNAIAPEWNKFKVKDEKQNPETIKFLKKQKGNVLDHGSGAGRYLIKTKCKLHLVDFSEEMIKLAKKRAKELGITYNKKQDDLVNSPVNSRMGGREFARDKNEYLITSAGSSRGGRRRTPNSPENISANFQISELTKLPYPDEFFDAAISISSLHCLPKKNHKKAIKELHRVLKPKAIAQISVWNKNNIRFKNAGKEKFVSWRDKGKRYYYLFDEKEIHKLFKDAGFKIKKKFPLGVNIMFEVEKI